MKSRSIIRTRPTPARTSALAITEPSAPQPTTTREAFSEPALPSGPMPGKMICREYLSGLVHAHVEQPVER